MTHPNAAKGARWERQVRDYLRESFSPWVARIRGAGLADEGDLGGVDHFAIQCKDWEKPNLAKFVADANDQARNAMKPWGVAVVKRRRKPTEDAYAVMDLATFVEVLNYIRSLEEEPSNEAHRSR